jgi:hypothetical protein
VESACRDDRLQCEHALHAAWTATRDARCLSVNRKGLSVSPRPEGSDYGSSFERRIGRSGSRRNGNRRVDPDQTRTRHGAPRRVRYSPSSCNRTALD